MEKVKIGKTLVCPLGFGTYNFGVKRTSLNEDKKVLEKAIEILLHLKNLHVLRKK